MGILDRLFILLEEEEEEEKEPALALSPSTSTVPNTVPTHSEQEWERESVAVLLGRIRAGYVELSKVDHRSRVCRAIARKLSSLEELLGEAVTIEASEWRQKAVVTPAPLPVLYRAFGMHCEKRGQAIAWSEEEFSDWLLSYGWEPVGDVWQPQIRKPTP